MLDVSSYGRVAPKTKSINVNANLLSQRIAERARLHDSIRKRIALTLMIGICAILFLPPIYRAKNAAAEQLVRHQKQAATLAAQLKNIKDEQDKVGPTVQNAKLLAAIRKNRSEFLGQVLYFLNTSNPSVGLEFMKATASSGTLDISSRVTAIDYQSAANFVDANEHSPHSQGTSLNSLRANQADPTGNGVTFEFAKKVKVGE